MQIINHTPFPEGLVVQTGPSGKPTLTVIVKGTFCFPSRLKTPAVQAEEQFPLANTDEFFDEENFGSIRIESDMVPFKPRTDVVVIGKACAPQGRPVKSLAVGIRVGPAVKLLKIHGNRKWFFPTKLTMLPVMSDPEPFMEMPIVYERAFGGIDHAAGKWCRENLVGCGFIGKKKRDSVHGKPLPNIEDAQNPITSWDSQPKPAGFGFYGRGWQPRQSYVGTFDEKWEAERAPELPLDFRFDFYNGAHPDLQVPGYLKGNELVEMRNLTPDGYAAFNLPGMHPEVRITKRTNLLTSEENLEETSLSNDETETISQISLPEESQLPNEKIEMNLDTVVFFPDEKIFYQVWRGIYILSEFSVEEIQSIRIQLERVQNNHISEMDIS